MSYYGYGFRPYVSVAKQQTMAEKAIKAAKKKGIIYEPVIAKGRNFCSSWWSQAWCDNLEQYSDYENRLPRGRSYLRNGLVIDLQISKGEIRAKVQGKTSKPYNIVVCIDPLKKEAVERIQQRCEFGITSLDALINGEFPRELQDLFTSKEGLFPTPREIHFDCSCPDGAYLCKHIAAVMYGVAVRLDEKPLLFFELRGIDPQSLVEKAIENRLELMLKNKDRPSSRILQGDVSDLFGI